MIAQILADEVYIYFRALVSCSGCPQGIYCVRSCPPQPLAEYNGKAREVARYEDCTTLAQSSRGTRYMKP